MHISTYRSAFTVKHFRGSTGLCVLLSILAFCTSVWASDPPAWQRVVYYDANYPSAWSGGTAVRDALSAQGYAVLNANELKLWMLDRIQDGHLSVVVFGKDVVPDTVAESESSNCTLRRYLNAGGKIVWYGDIPMYYQGHSDGTKTTWDTGGAQAILGFHAAGGTWDLNQPVTITSEGTAWGLQNTWSSVRPSAAGDLRVLAQDVSGDSAAWVKHYVKGDEIRGFVRFHDVGGTPNVDDVLRLAEYEPAIVFGDNVMDDIVATFFYPWYSNPDTSSNWRHWNNATHFPPTSWTSHYLPSYPDSNWNPATQLYDSANIEALKWQDKNMARAGIDIAIASWWGIGSPSDNAFSQAITTCKSVQWTIYYELDSQGDPSPQKIHDDIKYVIDTYGPTRNYAKVDGKWLFFVYVVGATEAADRWRQAKTLINASGYEVFFNGDEGNPKASEMPDPWDAVHRYSATSYHTITSAPSGGDDSTSLSPGFWVMYETPRLTRSLTEYTNSWNNAVSDKFDARFLLHLTWNEWHEGTQIEPGQEIIDDYVNGFAPAGNDYAHTYIDAIAPMATTLRWQSAGHRAIAPVGYSRLRRWYGSWGRRRKVRPNGESATMGPGSDRRRFSRITKARYG